MQYAGSTDVGKVREKNEDSLVVLPEENLFIVSDGMGGNFAGEWASRFVIEALPLLIKEKTSKKSCITEIKKAIHDSIVEISNDLRDKTKDQPGFAGMGATLVLVKIIDNQAIIAHMGDSRIYLFKDGDMQQITKDHSMIQLLIDNKEITPEEALNHPAKNQLTRHMGMEQQPLPETQVIDLDENDVLLLCSDGLTGMVDDKLIKTTLQQDMSLDEINKQLIATANKNGGEDNITVVTVKC